MKLLLGLLSLCFISCASVPTDMFDTTGVDNVIVDLADNAGTIEVQTVTVYETVMKLIYQDIPENKARVEAQFNAVLLSVTKEKALVKELARVHAIEVGRATARIAYLAPFEIECEKERARKWKAYALLAFTVTMIACYFFIKTKIKLPF